MTYKRRPLRENDEDSEDARFVKYVTAEITLPDAMFYNPANKEMNQADIDLDDYVYDEALKAMVAKQACNKEYCPPADDYDNNDIFYEYKRLDDITLSKRHVNIAKTSVIYSVCDPEYGF